jgi:PPK2 family polyphosphate:nucleotide phosphotransferase
MPSPLKPYRLVDDRKLDLSAIDPAKKVVDDDGSVDDALRTLQDEIAKWQNRLFAEHRRSLLLVLQGIDTSGKDGTTIAVFGRTHPQGVVVTPFKAPSDEESAHDFLWRVHPHVPGKGMIAVFNRSHYEAVIAERVLGLADAAECRRRYVQIVDFERLLVEHGTCVVKCFLHISRDEQRKRLQSRLDEPAKHWKFNPNDLVERKRWPANMAAYEDAIRATATKTAPWWIVPSDAKGHRNLMVATIVRDALAKLDPQYPALPAADRGLTVV